MILGIVSFIFSFFGILGYFFNVYVLLYISLAINIIEEIISVLWGGQNSFVAIPLAILFGIGAAIAGGNFIMAVGLALCFENVIMDIAGTIFILKQKRL